MSTQSDWTLDCIGVSLYQSENNQPSFQPYHMKEHNSKLLFHVSSCFSITDCQNKHKMI